MTQKIDDSNMNMIKTMKMQNYDNCVTVSWEDRKVGVSSKADLWTIVGKKSFAQIDTKKRDLEKSIINKNLKQKKKNPYITPNTTVCTVSVVNLLSSEST